MKDCLFCKIFKGEIPSSRVFENESVIGFKDLHPLAPVHVLFIHKNHSSNINEVTDAQELADVFKAIKEFTRKSELDKTGFRVVTNVGPHGGQSVFHTHYHVLGGGQLRGFGA